MGGSINTFVLASNTNADKFKTAFIMFLQDLKLSKDDVDHLLANMSSYFAKKNRGNLAGTDLFEGEDNKETNILKNYLLSVYTSEIFNEVAEQLARHAKFIENKGSSILKESLQELVN